MRTLLLMVAVLTVPACGNQSTSKPGNLGGSSDLTQALDCRPKPAPAALDDLNLDAPALPDLRHIPAESLQVTTSDGKVKSLCDLLRDSGKQLLVVQFVSVKCYTCQKWVEAANADLTAHGFDANGVLTVAVVVDPVTELTDAEMVSLKADVAPNATWARDTKQELWNFFSTAATADPAVTPLTIVMDDYARGFYCDTKMTPLATLVTIADQLMNLKIQPKS